MNTKQFGERVAALRKKYGMTQSQLAEQLNVSNKTISRWETGDGYPEITLLAPLAKALGVSVDYLLAEEPMTEDFEENPSPFETTENPKGKKAYRHRDIPVQWPGFSQKLNHNEEKITKKPGSQFWASLLHPSFYAITTCVFLSANHYGLYTVYENGQSVGLQGYFTGKILGFLLLSACLVFYVFLTVLNILKRKKNPILRNSCTADIGISTFFMVALLVGIRPVCGTLLTESYIMKDYCPGSYFHGFDYFQYNRKLIFASGCLAIGLYLLLHLNHLLRKHQRREVVIKSFWSSLIIFNKIGLTAALISVSGMILAVICALLYGAIEHMGIFDAVRILNLMPLVLVSNLCSASSKIGLLASLAGLGAGLLDCYDRQYKASLIIAGINLIFAYLLPLLIAVLQITNMVTGMSTTLDAANIRLW